MSTEKNIKRKIFPACYTGLFFVLPAFLYHFVIVMLPSFRTIILSLYNWNGLNIPVFIGFANYIEMMTADDVMPVALKNTAIWTLIFITIPIIVSIVVAVLVSSVKFNFLQMFYRTVYFLPYVLSASIAGKLWANFYSPFFGLNIAFKNLGWGNLSQVLWLGNPSIALFSVAFVSNWHWWGFVMVLFISALQQIEPQLYEAARIDGAGRVQCFFNITLPCISPTIVFIITMSLMWSILSFDFVWVMTMGGPGQATEMLSTWIYKNAFSMYRAGYANAICVLQSVLVMAVFFFNQRFRKRVEEYL
jgi:raffinose/stachyose/melibiose transport system permease protein